MDTQKIRELLDRRDELDRQIADAVGPARPRAAQKCSICQQEGHSARTCPQKQSGE
jgi:Zinc knuckle